MAKREKENSSQRNVEQQKQGRVSRLGKK